MADIASPVAASVRAELARARISGRQLAREFGQPPAWAWRRLSGRTPMTVDELLRIAAYLEVPVTTFLQHALTERASA